MLNGITLVSVRTLKYQEVLHFYETLGMKFADHRAGKLEDLQFSSSFSNGSVFVILHGNPSSNYIGFETRRLSTVQAALVAKQISFESVRRRGRNAVQLRDPDMRIVEIVEAAP